MGFVKSLNPHFAAKVQSIFEKAAFIQDLGLRLGTVSAGEVETLLAVLSRHLQQDGVVHAGVQATMADHTAGMAAASLVAPPETVLSVEFKLNLLRPAVGEALRCVATVLRQGRTLIIAESEVFAREGGRERLASKATVTLAVVEEERLRRREGGDA